ncbi:MAG: hypothetical protein U0Q03_04825 [Acidimicrobiales bacterium]
MEESAEPLAPPAGEDHQGPVIVKRHRPAPVTLVVVAVGGLAVSVLAARNPGRYVVLDEYPLIQVAMLSFWVIFLGGSVWAASKRWWWRLLAGGALVAGSLYLVVLASVLIVFLNSGRPLHEASALSPSGGQIVVQTMQTGMGPDSSCVRIDVRESDGPFASHRISKCASQEFGVDVRLDPGDRVVLILDGDVECAFDVDWSSQRLTPATSHERCLTFLD